MHLITGSSREGCIGMAQPTDKTDKPVYCACCGNEIIGDCWYKGKFITYTHKTNGMFLCYPLDFTRIDHADPARKVISLGNR